VAKLIYSTIASLDGYVADKDGDFNWAAPNEEVFAFVNDLERPIGTYLYGRRMYEVMRYWETFQHVANGSRCEQEFAEIWQAADKVVYSATLDEASTTKTRIEQQFDPDAVQEMKEVSTRDLSVGGPNLAGQAIRAGLVDECHLFLNPIVVGGGNPSLPDDARVDLELLDERRFDNGVVHLHYCVMG
jgi:dihydrofolate reductase